MLVLLPIPLGGEMQQRVKRVLVRPSGGRRWGEKFGHGRTNIVPPPDKSRGPLGPLRNSPASSGLCDLHLPAAAAVSATVTSATVASTTAAYRRRRRGLEGIGEDVIRDLTTLRD